MGKTVAIKREEQTLQHELTAEDLANQAKSIMEIKKKIMKEGVHYGIIPGCNKPSLLKPGAEKLCTAFMLQPEFETTSREDPNRTINWERWDYKNKKQLSGTTKGYIDYDSGCTLVHIPTGQVWAKKVSGSCNNFESKYRSLNPYDIKNTLGKMSEKRALVAAVLMGTALSDMFTQDIEDMPYLFQEGKDQPKAPAGKPVSKGEAPKEASKGEADETTVKLATDKQVAYIKTMIEKHKINQIDFLGTWVEEFDNWENIPFHKVNSILEWIRGQ